MSLVIVPPDFVDYAWRKEGADCIAEALIGIDEITPDQLKMMLSRGERYLVKILDGEKTVGWGTFAIDNYPNLRLLHITTLVAHNCEFERFFDEIRDVARKMGCTSVRFSAKKAQARLFMSKVSGCSEVYTTIEVKV